MAESVGALILKRASGLDFNSDNESAMYILHNLSVTTVNSPVVSSSSCIYFNIVQSSYTYELILGLEEKIMYGRYNKEKWVNLTT